MPGVSETQPRKASLPPLTTPLPPTPPQSTPVPASQTIDRYPEARWTMQVTQSPRATTGLLCQQVLRWECKEASLGVRGRKFQTASQSYSSPLRLWEASQVVRWLGAGTAWVGGLAPHDPPEWPSSPESLFAPLETGFVAGVMSEGCSENCQRHTGSLALCLETSSVLSMQQLLLFYQL